MRINFEDLGLQKNEAVLYRSFIGELFNCALHYHDCYELTLIKNSSGTLLVDSEVYNYTKGDLFLFGPNVPHSFIHNPNSLAINDKPEGLVILINQDYLNASFRNWNEHYLLTILFDNALQGIAFNTRYCKATLKAYKTFESEQVVDLKALKLISNIIFELAECEQYSLLRNNNSQNTMESEQQIQVAKNYVNVNFAQDVKTEDVAKILNMSYSSFNRFFKQKTKMTFSEYLQMIRLSHSKKLLVETTKSINEISYECGFNNHSFFNRVFKKKQNCTPKDYRIKYT